MNCGPLSGGFYYAKNTEKGDSRIEQPSKLEGIAFFENVSEKERQP